MSLLNILSEIEATKVNGRVEYSLLEQLLQPALFAVGETNAKLQQDARDAEERSVVLLAKNKLLQEEVKAIQDRAETTIKKLEKRVIDLETTNKELVTALQEANVKVTDLTTKAEEVGKLQAIQKQLENKIGILSKVSQENVKKTKTLDNLVKLLKEIR